ncbi:hypothetical protein DMP23_09620 [Amycolatopsis sp. A1MSW2902]|uniref:ABC transporter substrate-binding protein n=1 Tax=Amycolatopsis sp. A1MSW2902 TaxID=687413 RepID=UPI00307FAF7E
MRSIRPLAALLTAVVLLEGGSSGGEPEPTAAETVTVTAAGKEVTVPVIDTGIWALEYQTALNLLSIGVVPAYVSEYAYEPDPMIRAAYTILEDAGVKLMENGKAERIAAAKPELILGNPIFDEKIVDQIDQVAPMLPCDSLQPLNDELTLLGTITGHASQADSIIDAVAADRAEMADRITSTDFAGASVSVLSACGEDAICIYGTDRAFGPLLAALGFTRPASPDTAGNEWGYETISSERLNEQVADIVVALTGSVAFGAPSPIGNPLFDTSKSVTGEVDYSARYGAGPLNQARILRDLDRDLDASLFGEGEITTEADAPALWAEAIEAAR